jgi:DNA polymerase-3 subunit delta'
LFYGAKGLGKKLIARYFVSSLFCEHLEVKPCNKCRTCKQVSQGTFPNFYTLGKNREDLSAENIKEFLAKLSLTAADGGNKLVIIQGVENINLFSANALLKTLEEPPKNTTIILIADRINNLPSTVISRCQLLKFQPLDKKSMQSWLENFDFGEEEKQTILNLSFGKPGLALEFIEDKLAGFKIDCDFLIKLLSSDTLSSLQTMDHWFTALKKEYPHYKIYELGAKTAKHLDLLELILRDILWIKLSRQPVNVLYQEVLTKLANQYSSATILKNFLAIDKIKRQLKNNVSPLMLWEKLILDFKI